MTVKEDAAVHEEVYDDGEGRHIVHEEVCDDGEGRRCRPRGGV